MWLKKPNLPPWYQSALATRGCCAFLFNSLTGSLSNVDLNPETWELRLHSPVLAS